MTVNVFDILKSQNASLHDDGLAIYNVIKKHLGKVEKDEISVDFSGIKRCSTLFLNASFGKLLAEYGEPEVSVNIHPVSYDHILNFMNKFNDMWDNFKNKSNYQAYREEAFA